MNIGYFINFPWNPVRSGSGIHAYQLAKELKKRGHKIYRIYPERPSDEMAETFSKRDLFGFLKKIDVVYIRVDEFLRTDKFTLLKILKLFKLPVVWEINAPLSENLSLGISAETVRKMERKRAFLGKFVDTAITTCDELKDYAVTKLSIPNSYSVPLGSDPDMFSPQKRKPGLYGKYDDCFKVVWVGSAQYTWQGLDDIFKVARVVREKDSLIQFFIIGKKDNQELDNQGLDNVHIIERMPYEAVPEYIASADIGLCLYNLNGQRNAFYRSPLKLFDYMSSGLPVIATRVGQIADVIDSGHNGFLAEHGDTEAIVQHILDLKNDRAKAVAVGNQARWDVLNYHNWSRVAEDTDNILKTL